MPTAYPDQDQRTLKTFLSPKAICIYTYRIIIIHDQHQHVFIGIYIYVVVLVKVWPFIGRWCRVIIGQEEQWSVGASEICGVDNVLDISSQLVQGNCTWYYFWYLVLSCLCGRCFFSFCIPFCPLLATRPKSYKNWTLAKRKRV